MWVQWKLKVGSMNNNNYYNYMNINEGSTYTKNRLIVGLI